MTEGRDITPFEDRPSLAIHYNNQHLVMQDLEEDGYNDRSEIRPNHLFNEPLDESSDSMENIASRAFQQSRPNHSATANFYYSEENRLGTFRDWHHQHIVRKEDLAMNGFIYTGTGDKVRCIFCNGILRQWDRQDVVEDEHRRNFPSCQFIRGHDVGNIALQPLTNGHHVHQHSTSFGNHSALSGARPSYAESVQNLGHNCNPVERQSVNGCYVSDAIANKSSVYDVKSPRLTYSKLPRNPVMAIEPDRLETFKSWPAQMKQKPKQLAQAGLYYTGDGDKVKCFFCDVQLFNWEREDDPFVEHARWSPQCEFLQLVKGEAFVNGVQSGKITQDSLLSIPAVQAVLELGYDDESVQRALSALRDKGGADETITAEKLLRCITEFEDAMTTADTINTKQPKCKEVEKLQIENETLRDKQLCKVCMEANVEVIFYPCKHFACCASCSVGLPSCPICRAPIKGIDKVYLA